MISLFFLTVFSAGAQVRGPGVWVSCSGEAFVRNITVEEAHNLALQRAMQDAVEKACGIAVQSETLVKNFMTAGDFVHAISQGRVVEEKDMQWETVSIPADKPDRPPVIMVRVTMNARVLSETGEADPNFRISLIMDKREFLSGEEAVFQIQAARDCHVTLLNLAANDSVYVLFPNNVQKDNFLKAGEIVKIPEGGFKIRVATLPGHARDSEVVMAIATKQNFRFFEESDMDPKPGSVGTPRFAALKLARILSGIPKSERVEDLKVYTVTSE